MEELGHQVYGPIPSYSLSLGQSDLYNTVIFDKCIKNCTFSITSTYNGQTPIAHSDNCRRQIAMRAKSDSLFDENEQSVIRVKSSDKFHTNHIYFPKERLEEASSVSEFLVPIRIEIDMEGYKIREAFTWNLNDSLMTPEHFALLLCEDLDLPNTLQAPIATSIQGQLDSYSPYKTFVSSMGELEPETVVIELDLNVGNYYLKDRFEWDITENKTTPEMFARQLVAELGIGGEFISIIAHSIHEQLFLYRRRIMVGDTDGQPKNFVSIREEEEASFWSPTIEILNEQELEKLSEDQERAARRRRRENREMMETPITIRKKKEKREEFTPTAPVDTNTPTIKRRPGRPPGRKSLSRNEEEKCLHCGTLAKDTSLMRKGPSGNDTLCNSCGLYWINFRTLPENRKNLHLKNMDPIP